MYLSNRFSLQIDNITVAQFSEVTIPNSSNTVEYRDGEELSKIEKVPGLMRYGNVILKQGIADSMECHNWHKQVVGGYMKKARKNVQIILMNERGEKQIEWNFKNCFPVKYDAPDLNASDNGIAIDILEFAHEGMTRIQ